MCQVLYITTLSTMIKFKLAELLEEKEWTAYRLAREAKITMPVAYKLADPDVEIRRVDVETLEKLCRTLGVQPGDLLEYVPEKAPARRGKR